MTASTRPRLRAGRARRGAHELPSSVDSHVSGWSHAGLPDGGPTDPPATNRRPPTPRSSAGTGRSPNWRAPARRARRVGHAEHEATSPVACQNTGAVGYPPGGCTAGLSSACPTATTTESDDATAAIVVSSGSPVGIGIAGLVDRFHVWPLALPRHTTGAVSPLMVSLPTARNPPSTAATPSIDCVPGPPNDFVPASVAAAAGVGATNVAAIDGEREDAISRRRAAPVSPPFA